MLIKILLTILASLISGLFYHLSGLGACGKKKYPWAPLWLFNRQWRRTGCMLLDTATILLWWQPDVWYGWLLVVASMGLCYAAITTYWDWLFGFDNHWFHGFGIGLSRLPLIFCGKAWWLILVRAVVLAVLMGWVSTASKKDWKEEIGRGFAMPISGWI